MTKAEPPKRKRLNTEQRRALKATKLKSFVQQYGRRAQKGVEPNDRRYDREVEKIVKRMRPDELDRLLRGDDE